MLAPTSREDLLVGAVEGQAEDVGQMLTLQLHRFGASMNGFFHVPEENTAVVSSCRPGWIIHKFIEKKNNLKFTPPNVVMIGCLSVWLRLFLLMFLWFF